MQGRDSLQDTRCNVFAIVVYVVESAFYGMHIIPRQPIWTGRIPSREGDVQMFDAERCEKGSCTALWLDNI